MIIVIGSITVRTGCLDDALALCLEHVHRSRAEPGCISHDVHHDAERSHRLVFVERWVDHDALVQHFDVPESNSFVRDLGALADEPPSIEIYEAERA